MKVRVELELDIRLTEATPQDVRKIVEQLTAQSEIKAIKDVRILDISLRP
jgi:hypothetical protein